MLNIRQHRLINNMSIQDMADLCDVHRNTYSAWEKNPAIIPSGKAFIIASRFGVTIEDIIFLDSNSTKCCEME